MGKALGEFTWETGFDDGLLGSLDVILQTFDFQTVLLKVADNVACVGIMVAGLTNRSDVHKIAAVRTKIDFRLRRTGQISRLIFDDEGLVAVSDEANLLGVVVEVRSGLAHCQNIVPLTGILWRCVDVEEVVGLVLDCQGHVAEEGDVVFREDFLRPDNGRLGDIVEIGDIGQQEACVVMVAGDNGDLAVADRVHALIRTGTVSDNVSTANEHVHVLAIESFENGLQSVVIPVNIREDSDTLRSGCQRATLVLIPSHIPYR